MQRDGTSSLLEYVLDREPFTVRRTVKWTDCDPAGVVYTGIFVDYVTSAQRLFLGHVLDMKLQAAVDALRVDFPAKALSFVFHSSMRPDDVFDLAVGVTAIKNTTFETEHVGLKSTGEPAFTARFTTICVSPKERRAILVPELLRERFKPHIK